METGLARLVEGWEKGRRDHILAGADHKLLVTQELSAVVGFGQLPCGRNGGRQLPAALVTIVFHQALE